MLALKNKIRWLLYVLTRSPRFLPNPDDVAKQNLQESVNNVWRRINKDGRKKS